MADTTRSTRLALSATDTSAAFAALHMPSEFAPSRERRERPGDRVIIRGA